MMTFINPDTAEDTGKLRAYLNSRADILWSEESGEDEEEEFTTEPQFIVSMTEDEVETMLEMYNIKADYSEI